MFLRWLQIVRELHLQRPNWSFYESVDVFDICHQWQMFIFLMAWWIRAFRLVCWQARTWRAGHQTRGKGSCGDEGRGAGSQTSHLPPLLPRGLQGMGTLLVPSPKRHPSHPPPSILSVRFVYRPGASSVWPWWPFSPTFFPNNSIICTPAPESVFSFLSLFFVLLCDVALLWL